MIDWFRSWHGAPTDSKWLVIAKRANVAPGVVSAIVWALFDHASKIEDRGNVADFDFETYAVFSGFDEDQVRAVYVALEGKGVIISGRLARWEKRQPRREDHSSERVAKSRQRREAEPDLPLEIAAEKDFAAAPLSAQESQSETVPDAGLPNDEAAVIAIRPEAIRLADEIAVIAGHDLKLVPPSWCGAATRVEMWMVQGWRPPLILESARAQMVRKRDGPPGTIRYFEKGIAQAHAAGDAPLPIVKPIEQETIYAKTGNSGGFSRLARALREGDGAGSAEGRRASGALRVIDGSDHP